MSSETPGRPPGSVGSAATPPTGARSGGVEGHRGGYAQLLTSPRLSPRRCEGVYGMAIMLCLLLPAVQLLPGREGGGVHEDSIDTLCMLCASGAIRQVAACSVAAMAVYNVAGMLVTDSLGAVTRTVLETMRTLLVWVLNLLLFYAGSRGGKHGRPSIGEPWTSHSWLQAVGFAVLVVGTLVYGALAAAAVACWWWCDALHSSAIVLCQRRCQRL